MLFDFVSPRQTKGVVGLELVLLVPQTLSYAQFWPWRLKDNVLFYMPVSSSSTRTALP